MKKRLDEQAGVTMMILVVTIIILLILTGVTLRAALGDDGTVEVTKETIDTANERRMKEEIDQVLTDWFKTEESGKSYTTDSKAEITITKDASGKIVAKYTEKVEENEFVTEFTVDDKTGALTKVE